MAQGLQGQGAPQSRELPSQLPPAASGTPRAAAAIAPEQAVAEALQGILKGYRFNKRLLAQDPADHWMLFTRGAGETALVGWTERDVPEQARLALSPASPMAFNLYRYDGELIRPVETVGYEIGMVLERTPQVLLPSSANAFLMLAASAQTVPSVMRVQGPRVLELTCDFYNPLDEIAVMPVPDMDKTFALQPGGTITVRKQVDVGRSSEPIYTSIGAMGIRQPVTIIIENPLELSVRPEEPQVLTLDIVNHGGAELTAEVLLSLSDVAEPFRLPLQFRSGQRVNSVRIPLSAALPLPTLMSVSIEQTVGQPMRRVYTLAQTGELQFLPAANFIEMGTDGAPVGYRAEYAGAASAVVRGGVPNRTSVPWPNYGALGVVYDLGQAAADAADAAQVDIVPASVRTEQVFGNPSQIAFWLQGDASGNRVNLVWRDAAGNEYVSEDTVVNWRGWRYLMLRVPAGAQVQYPLSWVSFLRVDAGDKSAARHGVLLANGYCFIYGDNFSRSGYSDLSQVQYEQSVSVPAAPATFSEPEILRGKPVQRSGGGAGGRR